VEDLRQFMIRNEMSTNQLDKELDGRPYCWECHHSTHKEASVPGPPCGECPVYRTKALNCFELRAISAGEDWAGKNCDDCTYYQKWANQRSDE
jgi:hypothetical protein